MRTKPVPNPVVIVLWHKELDRLIKFQASRDAADDFADFGNIWTRNRGLLLQVDDRYDFDEVLEYIQEYNNDA